MADLNHPLRVYQRELFLGVDAFDAASHLKPVAVLAKMQELGTSQCEVLGYDEAWMQEQGFFWVMVRMHLEIYHAPPVGFIRGETWRVGNVGALWRRDYLLHDLSGHKQAAGVALWALVSRKNRQVLRPEHYPQGFPSTPEYLALAEPPKKLVVQEMPLWTEFPVVYSDLDSNGHAHNGRYTEWLLDALPAELVMTHQVGRLQIDFRSEAYLGEVLQLHAAKENPGVWRFAAYTGERLCFVAEMQLV
ncbi:MAG: thioesterase [Symbiobacteriaceae bacterium]|nr:thioesterase [Symbiobacteriaceae bacterium]